MVDCIEVILKLRLTWIMYFSILQNQVETRHGPTSLEQQTHSYSQSKYQREAVIVLLYQAIWVNRHTATHNQSTNEKPSLCYSIKLYG